MEILWEGAAVVTGMAVGLVASRLVLSGLLALTFGRGGRP